MYRFILASLSILFVGSVVNASTISANKDVRLHLQVRSLAVGGPGSSTSVFRNGKVVTQTCRMVFPKPCTVAKVQHLSARQMDRVERLIDRARFGKIVKTQGIHCMAMPSESFHFSADNNQVFLREAARPCGLPTNNTSPAASKLVTLLDNLHNNAFLSDAATDTEDLSLDLDE